MRTSPSSVEAGYGPVAMRASLKQVGQDAARAAGTAVLQEPLTGEDARPSIIYSQCRSDLSQSKRYSLRYVNLSMATSTGLICIQGFHVRWICHPSNTVPLSPRRRKSRTSWDS